MDRMVMIFNVCFMLIALMGIACVSACDVDSCSVDDIQQVDLENISAVEDISVCSDDDLENVGAADNQNDLENNDSGIPGDNLTENPEFVGNWGFEPMKNGNVSSFVENSTVGDTQQSTCDNVTEECGEIDLNSNELENTEGFFKKVKKMFKSVKNVSKTALKCVDNVVRKAGEFSAEYLTTMINMCMPVDVIHGPSFFDGNETDENCDDYYYYYY